MRMLQGTMAMEGQGLDRAVLKAMAKRTARDLLTPLMESRIRGDGRGQDRQGSLR
jgi:hypothetical protein